MTELEALYVRHSVRSYLDKAIEPEKIRKLQELIDLFSEKHRGSFIRERNVSSFDVCFFKLMEKFQIFYNAHPRGKGKYVGIEMIKLLNELDTDDDLFPEYEIECIQRIIGDI